MWRIVCWCLGGGGWVGGGVVWIGFVCLVGLGWIVVGFVGVVGLFWFVICDVGYVGCFVVGLDVVLVGSVVLYVVCDFCVVFLGGWWYYVR